MNIDSDKLLQFIDDEIQSFTECLQHGDEYARVVRTELHMIKNKIRSGELAAKRVYARAPNNINDRVLVKPGREYLVSDDDGETFKINLTGPSSALCCWRACAHLNGGNWERVEK